MLTRIKAKLKILLFKGFDNIYHCSLLYESEISDIRVNVHPTSYGHKKGTFKLFRKDDYIEVGKYCSIAENVTMIASGEHYINNVSTFPFYDRRNKTTTSKDTDTKGSIIIANDVWLGFSSTILSGVKIGNGAVVAAGSLVIEDIPDYAVVAGIPARVIKYRFPQCVIDALLEIAWWNWNEGKIEAQIDDFYLPVEEFILKHKNKEENHVI